MIFQNKTKQKRKKSSVGAKIGKKQRNKQTSPLKQSRRKPINSSRNSKKVREENIQHPVAISVFGECYARVIDGILRFGCWSPDDHCWRFLPLEALFMAGKKAEGEKKLSSCIALYLDHRSWVYLFAYFCV